MLENQAHPWSKRRSRKRSSFDPVSFNPVSIKFNEWLKNTLLLSSSNFPKQWFETERMIISSSRSCHKRWPSIVKQIFFYFYLYCSLAPCRMDIKSKPLEFYNFGLFSLILCACEMRTNHRMDSFYYYVRWEPMMSDESRWCHRLSASERHTYSRRPATDRRQNSQTVCAIFDVTYLLLDS